MAIETISNLTEQTIDKYADIANSLNGQAKSLPIQSGEIIGKIHYLTVCKSLRIHSKSFDHEFRKFYTRKDDLTVWFYDRAAKFQNELIEITEDDFDYILGCVPPFYRKDDKGRTFNGCSEMYSDNVTFWFTQTNGKFYGVLSNLQTAKNLFNQF